MSDASTTETAKPSNQELAAMRERAEALIDDRDKGWVPIEEWGPKCRGCGDDEYRIDGYCSCECRDWHTDDEAADVGRDVMALAARVEALLAERDAAVEQSDLWQGRFNAEYVRGAVLEAALRDALAFIDPSVARDYPLWRAVLAGGDAACPTCEGRREVPATPGQPGDGPMPCPACDAATEKLLAGGDAAPQTDNLGGDEVASSGGET